MTEIVDTNTYLRSMSTTLFDKVWWIDKIPSDIDTIVDFGCAQADLAVLINRIMPGRFHYIGIEESGVMAQLAGKNLRYHVPGTWEILPSLLAASESNDFKNSVLVLNSVLHEVFTYKSESEIQSLMSQIQDLGFSCIAIRDMCPSRFDLYDHINANCAILSSLYGDLWREYEKFRIETKIAGVTYDEDTWLPEFLLKYRYKANWEREKREKYLWNIPKKLTQYGLLDKYEIRFENRFYIPFIRDKIKEDFGIDWDYPTHIKLLLKLKNKVSANVS